MTIMRCGGSRLDGKSATFADLHCSARSLLPGAFRRFRPLRHELRIIPALKEDHAMQFLASQHGPASSRGGVHLGIAIPGPFHGWLAVPGGLAAIHVPLDVAE